MLLFCDRCRHNFCGEQNEDECVELEENDEGAERATNACVAVVRRATNSMRKVDLAAMVQT